MPKESPGSMSRQELAEAREQVQRQIDVLGGPMKGSIYDANRMEAMSELRAILQEINAELDTKNA
jgi:hypothetical protein